MKVLALASYPIEAAATRYRLQQFVVPLAARDIWLTIHPFLDSKLFKNLYRREAIAGTAAGLLKSAILRLQDLLAVRKTDVLMIQREAMLFGPPVIEWLSTQVLKRPMLLDLDDATYVSYTSPTYGRVGRAFKWFSKTDDLIRWAKVVTCGNRTIAEHVTQKGGSARIIPTVVDTEVFRPADRVNDGVPVIGWVGTHSTFSYLETIFPALQKLAESHSFRLKVVGSGRPEVKLPGIEVENLQWQLAREISDFQSFDIGLYPIDSSLYADSWAAGKSGFKAIQYMAIGIPYVATPVGAVAEIGKVGTTHFSATSEDEWLRSLQLLLSDSKRRQEMGAAGRAYAVKNFHLEAQAQKLATALQEVAKP
jgi:glycosyltransferase involved in cell wall biosynthesis